MAAPATIRARSGPGGLLLNGVYFFGRILPASMMLVVVLLGTAFARSDRPDQTQELRSLTGTGLTFVENRGQWDAEARFLVRTGGLDAWITHSGVVFDFHVRVAPQEPIGKRHRGSRRWMKDHAGGVFSTNEIRRGHVVRMQFEGASASAPAGIDRMEGYHNYFMGSDPSRWASEVPLYREVMISELYDGIGMRLYEDGGYLRYDLVAAPGADLAQVRMRLDGADGVRVTPEGDLAIQTVLGEVKQKGLLAYQEVDGRAVTVPAAFRLLEANVVGFEAEPFDRTLALVIDPLIYSTFLGGSGGDRGGAIAVDASGNAFVAGSTGSADFPTTIGAFQTSYPGRSFVTKLNADGGGLLYSTYLGGESEHYVAGIAVDASGYAFITGGTWSDDFPTTAGAFQTNLPGDDAAFVTKLSPCGTQLVYSTYVGGSAGQIPAAIAVDASGHAFITGETWSDDFPITRGDNPFISFDPWDYRSSAAFVTKLSSTGEELAFSKYLAIGMRANYGTAITVDAEGNPFVTGWTQRDEFPETGEDCWDCAFVAKLTAGGSLVYSTLVGGQGWDWPRGIAVDTYGSAIITGESSSIDFPSEPHAYPPGPVFAFVTKLRPSGFGLMYSVFLGGSKGWDCEDDGSAGSERMMGGDWSAAPNCAQPGDYTYAITVDASGNPIVTGWTRSRDFPTTQGAFQTTYPDGPFRKAFVTKFTPSGLGYAYSTFLGGALGYTEGLGIAADAHGNVYVTGRTSATDFPTTAGAFQTLPSGPSSAFVAKLQLEMPLPVELAAFTARAHGRDVHLAWRTLSESNNAGFEIELFRSGAFEAVGFVDGQGVSAQERDYEYIVTGLPFGRHRFRLKQIDRDGSFSYSPTAEVVLEIAGAYELSAAYPNPFNPSTNFTLIVAVEQRVIAEAFDVLGRRVMLVYDGIVPAQEELSLRFDGANLPSGLFMLRAEGEFFRATRRMILTK